ncbi:MAG TPA: outer membrane protein assembly factor BamD [Thermoanaerobaculia bacterium]|nr:outer membrane protein assembly factor BamD [Thermoanaerobaculia bacterium]
MTRTFRHRILAPSPLLLVVLLAAGLGAGCGSAAADDPVLRLSAAEALEEGKELMAREKYSRARRYLSHAYEVEPNSVAGREGLLLLADSFFLEGGGSNLIQAEAKYRDFLNRFPTSDQAAYAQFQIANSLARRMEKPNRDQTASYRALEAYEELLRLYPTSEYVAQAEQEIRTVRDRLAAHEFVVGDFYLRYRYPGGAITRFESLLEQYPDYSELDKVLYHLGMAYSRSNRPEHAGKAQETFERLQREFPESSWIDDIPSDLPAPPDEAPVERVAGTDAAASGEVAQ